jgi:NTP pyrophosphatase (non-canonical NTP hydrolase)
VKTLKELQQQAHTTARAKGWWDKVKSVESHLPVALCLIHSEVSEALESHRRGEPLLWHNTARNNKPEGVAAELADVVIRCMDVSAALGINLQAVVESKMAYNETRAYRHGDKRC